MSSLDTHGRSRICFVWLWLNWFNFFLFSWIIKRLIASQGNDRYDRKWTRFHAITTFWNFKCLDTQICRFWKKVRHTHMPVVTATHGYFDCHCDKHFELEPNFSELNYVGLILKFNDASIKIFNQVEYQRKIKQTHPNTVKVVVQCSNKIKIITHRNFNLISLCFWQLYFQNFDLLLSKQTTSFKLVRMRRMSNFVF